MFISREFTGLFSPSSNHLCRVSSELALDSVNCVHEAFSSLHKGMSSSTGHSGQLPGVAVGIAITAVAGVALAAAVGGSFLYTRRIRLNRWKKKPLTLTQWRNAFDAKTGQLINVDKLLKKIRYRGLEPSVRSEVWPFLLGLFQLESTSAEREAEDSIKRERYQNLRKKCLLMMEKNKVKSRTPNASRDPSQRAEQNLEIPNASRDPSQEAEHDLEESSDSMLVKSYAAVETSKDEIYSDDEEASLKHNRSVIDGRLINQIDRNSSDANGSMQESENFTSWQHIIRLDAVRMNAEWIPYSPSQANIGTEVANELALVVELKDCGHLEPCRKHHAARLVAILEAYALYDQEIGYCQGMSDLLSPFVALLDDDCKAFWCFAYFMNTARQNFREDGAGIWRQLHLFAKILKLSDPHLFQYLEKLHAENCFFIYRMMVVLLRRELSFEQTLSLWEILWADRAAVKWGRVKASWRKGRRRNVPTNHLLLYVIAAAIRQKRKFIMEKCKDGDDILILCNSMAGHLDIWSLLDAARSLVNFLHDKISD